MSKVPYNPLDKINLARSIEVELRSRPTEALDTTATIVGAGVYALYYRGSFSKYAPISSANAECWQVPIYIGKAIPKGGRKGISSDAAIGNALQSRLRKHAQSIKATENLHIDDFVCQHIVLDDIWIPLGENILIETFRPLWNVALEGFGINDPGGGRSQQKRSPWDILHPGRLYATRLTGGGPDAAAVAGRVEDHFAGRPLRPLPRVLATIAREANENDQGET